MIVVGPGETRMLLAGFAAPPSGADRERGGGVLRYPLSWHAHFAGVLQGCIQQTTRAEMTIPGNPAR